MARILVVDDDPDMLLAAKLCLESGGHTVIEAKGGPEGLEAVRAHKPDLIVLDVMMGTTTEGFQTALKLRSPDPASPFAAYGKIPILMITALHHTTDLRFAPDGEYLPVDDFVDKPIDPDDLIRRVDTLLAKAR